MAAKPSVGEFVALGHPSARSRVAALQRATFVLAQPTPDTGILAAFQRPSQAFGHYRTASAHGLRLFDLHQCRTGVADRKEQFRVLVAAYRAVTPVHGGGLLTWL